MLLKTQFHLNVEQLTSKSMGLSNGCVACSQLKGVIGGVHVLPFYPSSADRGFAPLTYMEVDPDFGTWDDIHKLGQGRDLCMDFMVNHISAQSELFKDFKEKGDKVRSMFSCTPKWIAQLVIVCFVGACKFMPSYCTAHVGSVGKHRANPN
jgi:hypothetical protein